MRLSLEGFTTPKREEQVEGGNRSGSISQPSALFATHTQVGRNRATTEIRPSQVTVLSGRSSLTLEGQAPLPSNEGDQTRTNQLARLRENRRDNQNSLSEFLATMESIISAS